VTWYPRVALMVATVDKGRAERLSRLGTILATRLENPAAALETLMSELKVGDPHPDLWAALHRAAERDGVEVEAAWAYQKITADRRLAAFPEKVAATILTNAADFSETVVGDVEGAEDFLRRSLTRMPDQPVVFDRLVRRYTETENHVRLVELYAAVAAKPPKPAAEIAHEAGRILSKVPAATPLADDVCQKLAELVPANLNLLDILYAHCNKTGRVKLACELYERAIEMGVFSSAGLPQTRRRLIELYLGDAADPAKAMPHVEALLGADPTDAKARDAARRLLSAPLVASRAATLLQRTRHVEIPPKSGR
jgi:tetratricopeptide (TPR) repeat protein